MKYPNSKLVLFLIFFFAVSTLSQAQCLLGWAYYAPVTITNNVSANLSSYQVKLSVNTAIPIAAGKMLSNGDDIRFTDPNTCTNISYWIESGINTSTTVIWVKMPALTASANTTINMYYGNASASSVSSGDNTFLVFDDFNGTSLNTSKWSTYGTGGSISFSGGKINFTTNGSGSNSIVIRSINSFPSPAIVEGMVTTVTNFYNTIGIVNSGGFAGYGLSFGNYSNSGTEYLFNIFANGGTFSGQTWITNTSPGTVTGLWQISWPMTGGQSAVWPGGSFSWNNTATSLSTNNQIVAGAHYWGQNTSESIDWIRARQYASKDPTLSFGSESLNSGIVTLPVTGGPFCTSSPFIISFNVYGGQAINSSNVFTAQLSDSSGSFTNPLVLGTISGSSAGNISATVPAGAIGTHYRVRVISSSPALIGSTVGLSVPARSVPAFNVNMLNQCVDINAYAVSNVSSGPSPLSYKWDLGDGNTATSAGLNFSYAASGTYILKLVSITPAGCKDSLSQTLTVYPQVNASFTVNTPNQCLKPQNFEFTDQSTVPAGNIVSWAWDFGDSSSAVIQNPTHVYATPGTYKVKLTAFSDKGCKSSFFSTVTVYPMPKAGFTVAKGSQCLKGNSFQFTNISTGNGTLSYNWNIGDGQSSSSDNLSYSYTAAGSFLVKLYATTSNGCIDSVNNQVVVFPKVVAGFTDNGATQCIKLQNYSFSNTSSVSSGTLTYRWSFGDPGSGSGTGGNNSTDESTVHYFKNTGSYLITLTATSDHGCTDSFSENITVNPSPSAIINAAGPTTLCAGNNAVLFANTGSGNLYQWYKDGVKLTGANAPSYFASASGTYSISVVNSNGCTDVSAGLKVTVNPLPVQPVITMIGRQLATNSANSYQWYLNGTLLAGATTQTITPFSPTGIYTVTITDANGCSNASLPFYYDVTGIQTTTDNYQVKIYPNPAHDLVNIDLKASNGDFENLELIDINGKTISKMIVKDKNGNIELQLGNVGKGLYFIKLIGNKGILVQKITKD